MADYHLTTTSSLFAKISDQLASYASNGLLDEGRFFEEVKLCTNILGLAAYEMVDAIVTLDNHRALLPCNFYLLDSAWLCDKNPVHSQPILQSSFVIYTETTNETIYQKDPCDSGACQTPADDVRDVISNGLIIQSTPCNNNNEHILDKVTVKEYIIPEGGRSITWRNPILLTLKNKKSITSDICTKDCKNLFSTSPYEIQITQQGISKYLHSTLKQPVIYLKYYAYPEDPETGLPLIPDVPILQRAIEYHLMYYFFYMTWLDGNDVNIERKVKDLEEKRDKYIAEAKNYVKIPSFATSIQMAQRVRSRYAAYELLNNRHF